MVLQWRMEKSGVTGDEHAEGVEAKLRKLERKKKKRKKGSGSDVPFCLFLLRRLSCVSELCERRLARPGSTMHSYAPLGCVHQVLVPLGDAGKTLVRVSNLNGGATRDWQFW